MRYYAGNGTCFWDIKNELWWKVEMLAALLSFFEYSNPASSKAIIPVPAAREIEPACCSGLQSGCSCVAKDR